MIIISALMVVISIAYFFVAYKAKHVGMLMAGVLWIIGAGLVYKFHVWWVAAIIFVLAILLNPNPEHD